MSRPVKQQPETFAVDAIPHVLDVTPPRCPVGRCGSTERTGFEGQHEHQYNGLDEAGEPYTHTVWAYCNCRKCGQRYKVRWRENRPE